jgi:hypothetical protein
VTDRPLTAVRPFAAPPVPPGPPRLAAWVGRFAVAFAAVTAASYVLVEALDLRFVQPFRCDHMNKVRYFQLEVRDPAVLYLGTSQMHMGVIPAVVEEAARARGKDIGQGYNLAVPGADLELSWIVARDTVTGRRVPRVLVVGVFPLIMAADRWSPASDYVAMYGNFADVWGHVQFGDLQPTALIPVAFRGVQNLVQLPLYHTKKPIDGFRWDRLQKGRGAWWLPEEEATAKAVARERWQQGLDGQGAAQTYHFRDDSRPARWLSSLRDLAKARGMRFAVVYPPQHPDYQRRTMTPGSEERFVAWIGDFCRRAGIAYHDLSAPAENPYEDYNDPLHLNARGAARFSRRLAEVVASAWEGQP